MGRKKLLLYSVVSMGAMSALLAYGLDGGHRVLSGAAIVAFIVRRSGSGSEDWQRELIIRLHSPSV